LGRTEFRPIDYMRAFVIDDEFFNQSAIETTPRSSCRPALEKRLDTADIVRDVRITGLSDTCRRIVLMYESPAQPEVWIGFYVWAARQPDLWLG
jgi:hypothetical protein